MHPRTRRGQPDLPPDESVDPAGPDLADLVDGPGDDPAESRPSRPAPSLDGLSVAGFTRRRLAWLIAALVTAWIVVVFTRQVGEASAKAAEADQARVANIELQGNVVALQREYELIQRPAYIEQQAHGLGLGGARDHAFVVSPDAPPLPSDAPGSASVRLGATATDRSPLDSWLDLLFGPTPGG